MSLAGTQSRLPAPLLERRDPPPTEGFLVVVGDAVPDWVERWCAQSARELRTQVVPRAGIDRVRAIGVIAASAAHAGGAVLALPGAATARPGPPRVVVAVKDLLDDASAVADAATSAVHMGAELIVAHGVPLSFGERSVGLDTAVARAHALLDAAAARAVAVAPGVAVNPWLARVRPHELVGEELDADLLVLGGSRADVPDHLGLVARSALDHAQCAVLLIPRPARFPSGLSTCGP
jgi:nucleotide-binding universal stress UspA family protein